MNLVSQQVYALASEACVVNPELRWGQSVFNAAADLYPGPTNELRGGPLDPFYLDGLVELFVAALIELVKAPLTSG